jgi:Tfp pilus assembly PilM family ATPase
MTRQWNWTRRQFGPIGLDIGHDSVKMLQLASEGARLSVHRLLKRRFPQSDNGEAQRQDLILTMKKMLEEGGFHGTDAALCLANDKLKVTSIRLLESDVGHTTAQLYKEAALRFGLDPGKDPIQYLPAGTVHNGDQMRQEVVLFGAERSATEETLALLDAVGLTAVGLEPVACALARGFGRMERDKAAKAETLAFVDAGSRWTTVVVSRAGEISFVKVISAGTELFDQEVAAKLGVQRSETETWRRAWRAEEAENGGADQILPTGSTPADESASFGSSGHRKPLDPSVHRTLTDAIRSAADTLAREVALCTRYTTVTFRGQRIERILVSGGGAHEPALLAAIQAQAGSVVEVAAPLRAVEGYDLTGDESLADGGCEWAVAFGLAFKRWPAQGETEGAENRRRSLEPAA